MKRLLIIFLFFYFSSFAFCQFQAIMTNVMKSKELTSTVYSDLKQYRYEFEEDGIKGVMIVNQEANQTFILMPDKKFFRKTTCDDMFSAMNDPVQSYQQYKQYGKEKSVGNELINGLNCIKKELYRGDSKVYTMWFSEELNFPVKIINHPANVYMQLSDIKKWKPQDSFFMVPGDYTEVDNKMRPVIPEPPAPEKWVIKTVSLPFEGTIKRGTKLKFKIIERKKCNLSYANNTDKPAKFIRHSFRDGKEKPDDEQGPIKYRTFRLYPGDKSSSAYVWEPGNEILIEVYEGEIYFNIFSEIK